MVSVHWLTTVLCTTPSLLLVSLCVNGRLFMNHTLVSEVSSIVMLQKLKHLGMVVGNWARNGELTPVLRLFCGLISSVIFLLSLSVVAMIGILLLVKFVLLLFWEHFSQLLRTSRT